MSYEQYEEYLKRQWEANPKVYFNRKGEALGTILDYSGNYYDSELYLGFPFRLIHKIQGKTKAQLKIMIKD